MTVLIEPGGKILRGLALPFDEHALIYDGSDLYAEVFDRTSLEALPKEIPLLVSHNRNGPPAGMVRSTTVSSRGLELEAELVGSDDEVEGWRRKFEAGLMASLSIAFRADRPQWEKPPRVGLPPVKRVRGARIEEISLVNWPAYRSAGIDRVAQRTESQEATDLKYLVTQAEMPRILEEAERRLANRRK